MTELHHSQLSEVLRNINGGADLPVCLIHGQAVLVEQCLDQIIEMLLGSHQRDLCVQAIDGLAENIPNLLEEMNTFALLAGPKIVVYKEARIFDARSGHQNLVDQILAAFDADDMDQAARYYRNLCGRVDVDPADPPLGTGAPAPIKTLMGELGSKGVGQLAAYCSAKGWAAAAPKSYAADLQRSMEKGFPADHHLIVTVGSRVPKNLKLYKTFRDQGVVVDCNVPTGERRADKTAQAAVLRQALDQRLTASGKQLPGPLFQKLCKLTGFDLATFIHNIEKLIDYAGDRPRITAEDIDAVLERTKVDPIYELTNAVADRNPQQALFYTQTLLTAGWHPLQILAALANQMRKLLIAKDFTRSQWGSRWSAGISYQQFQSDIMPAIQSYDQHTRDEAAAWSDSPEDQDKKAKADKKPASDVALAPNPGNAYPVYQTLLKSEKYTYEEVIEAMMTLSRVDIKLKSTGQNPALMLKKAIMDICAPQLSSVP
jgi:DNA polymerase-3 subunit delta